MGPTVIGMAALVLFVSVTSHGVSGRQFCCVVPTVSLPNANVVAENVIVGCTVNSDTNAAAVAVAS
jgi:hypothetical protein